MDCEMPVMDGHTATRQIRRLENEGVLPLRNRIIALTGNARQGISTCGETVGLLVVEDIGFTGQIEASLQAGMDDVMASSGKIAGD